MSIKIRAKSVMKKYSTKKANHGPDAVVELKNGGFELLTVSSLARKLNSYEKQLEELTARVAELENPWVSVLDELPTEDGQYFVYVTNPYLKQSWATHGTYRVGRPWRMGHCNVTHWMKQPPPPDIEG